VIRVRCLQCQKLLGIPDTKAGQDVACPVCRGPIRVPGVNPPAPRPPSGVAAPARKPPQPALDQLEIVEDEEVPTLGEADLVDEPPAARKRKKRRPAAAQSTTSGNQIIGGILMMVGAVVWFFGALLLMNRIFFYPPILFVLGIGTLVRGIRGQS
jgi:hypothetical protein